MLIGSGTLLVSIAEVQQKASMSFRVGFAAAVAVSTNRFFLLLG
jgi:hypothetical protein